MTVSFTRLQTLLDAGEFVVSAGFQPQHHDPVKLMAVTEIIAPFVDVVQISHHLLTQVRPSCLVAVLQHTRLEPVVQLTLRRRNSIAPQPNLLEFAGLGIRNLIVQEPVPCWFEFVPQKTIGYLDTVEAIAAVRGLPHSEKWLGSAHAAVDFYVGAVASCPAPANFSVGLDQLAAAIEQGAGYIQVQTPLDLPALEQWMAAVRSRGLHKRAHFMAAMLLLDHQQLAWLPAQSGSPELLLEQIHGGNSDAVSLKTLLERIEQIRAIEGIRGLHLQPVGTEAWIPQIVQAAGLRQILV